MNCKQNVDGEKYCNVAYLLDLGILGDVFYFYIIFHNCFSPVLVLLFFKIYYWINWYFGFQFVYNNSRCYICLTRNCYVLDVSALRSQEHILQNRCFILTTTRKLTFNYEYQLDSFEHYVENHQQIMLCWITICCCVKHKC